MRNSWRTSSLFSPDQISGKLAVPGVEQLSGPVFFLCSELRVKMIRKDWGGITLVIHQHVVVHEGEGCRISGTVTKETSTIERFKLIIIDQQ